jgi:hypothetical protein
MTKYERRPGDLRSGPPRPADEERRRTKRLRLTLETAVPVLVRSGSLIQWGLARNVSEGGMLIELGELPQIGTLVEIKIAGVDGPGDLSAPTILHGEVRHHLAWNYAEPPQNAGLRAVGVRFVNPPEPPTIAPGTVLH